MSKPDMMKYEEYGCYGGRPRLVLWSCRLSDCCFFGTVAVKMTGVFFSDGHLGSKARLGVSLYILCAGSFEAVSSRDTWRRCVV